MVFVSIWGEKYVLGWRGVEWSVGWMEWNGMGNAERGRENVVFSVCPYCGLNGSSR
jgi:hypothetical protein